jgi:integrase
MASLRERNGWFQILFRYQRRQFTHALKTQVLREAEAMRGTLDRVLIRIKNQEVPPVPEGADVAEYLLNGGKMPEPPALVEKALTLKDLAERYEAAHQNGAVEKNSRGTDRKKIAATTLKKEIASLRAAWNWATRTGILKGNFPGHGLTYPKTDEKPPFQTREEIERKIARGGLSPEQIEELWESLFLTKPEFVEFLAFVKTNAHQPFLYPMVAFAAYTGARRSELLRVLIDDADLEGGTALVREKKRVRGKRSTRRVPLSGPLVAILKDWLAAHPGGQFLFCHAGEVFRSKKRSRTTGHRDEKERPSSLKGRVATVRKRERPGLGALTKDEAHDHFQRLTRGTKWEVIRGWHALRHSFISICAADGIDQRLIMSWVGHLSEETHRRYLHLVPSREQQAISGVFG